MNIEQQKYKDKDNDDNKDNEENEDNNDNENTQDNEDKKDNEENKRWKLIRGIILFWLQNAMKVAVVGIRAVARCITMFYFAHSITS